MNGTPEKHANASKANLNHSIILSSQMESVDLSGTYLSGAFIRNCVMNLRT